VASYGKVVGGEFINATINTNRRGELELAAQGIGLGFFTKAPKPCLTANAVASWEEIIPETRGGAAGAVSKVSQTVGAALPGVVGKATSAAIGSAAELVRAPHIVRVDWVDGKQSLIELPDKLFQHLAILLKDCKIATAIPSPEPPPPPGVVETLAKEASQLISSRRDSAQPDATEQIARLAALREQGALTEDEFAAKKAELLDRI
jgi:hypothetical protein